MMVRWISLVPPAIDAAFDHSHWRDHGPASGASATQHVEGGVGQVLRHVGPCQLDDARLGTGLRAAAEAREGAPVVQPQDPQLHVRLRERVRDIDVVEPVRASAPA